MSQLEVKEKELNKLKQESDQLVLNQHPASDKIEVGFMGLTFPLGKKLFLKYIFVGDWCFSIMKLCQLYLIFRDQHPRLGIGTFFFPWKILKYFILYRMILSQLFNSVLISEKQLWPCPNKALFIPKSSGPDVALGQYLLASAGDCCLWTWLKADVGGSAAIGRISC